MKPEIFFDQKSTPNFIISSRMFFLLLAGILCILTSHANAVSQLNHVIDTSTNTLSSENLNEESKDPCISSHCNNSSLNVSCSCPQGCYWTEGRCTEIPALPPDLSLLYTTTRPGSIRRLFTLDRRPISTMVVPHSELKSDIAAMTIHNNILYYCDKFSHYIYAKHFDNTKPLPELQGLSRCSGVAVDDYNIYWSDQDIGAIVVARLDNTAMRKVIHQEYFSDPSDLVWSQATGQLYYFQRDQDYKRLLCQLSPDGKKFSVLYTWENDPHPHFLAVKDNNLFWWEGLTLISMDLQALNKTEVLTLKSSSLPQSLAVLNNGGFAWSDDADIHLALIYNMQGRIFPLRFNTTKANPHLVLEYNFDPMLNESISKTECEHFYLPSPSGLRACVCKDGFFLEPENQTSCMPEDDACDSETQYRCADGTCIPSLSLCNGIQDCPTENEEMNCSICAQNEFVCKSGDCLSMDQKCDGKNDCSDGTDELDCGTVAVQCDFPDHLCDNSTKCIQASFFCNGLHNCDDGTDEPEHCDDLKKECSCQEICLLTTKGVTCACNEDKELRSDGKTCEGSEEEDICNMWGTCSQFCLHEDTGHRCSCAPGFHLLEDEFTCTSNDKRDPIVLVSTGSKLIGYNLTNHRHLTLKALWLERIGCFSYYIPPFDRKKFPSLFWCNTERQQILTSHITPEGEVSHPSLVAEGSLPKLDGMAVDWVNQRLYWLDAKLKNIEMAYFDGSSRASILSGLDEPHGLALDPHSCYIFWIDRSLSKGSIERSDLSGQHRTRILTKGDPTGLTLDYYTKFIYWLDLESHSVNVVDYNGRKGKKIRRASLTHPYSIALYGNDILWTDHDQRTLSLGSRWIDDNNDQVLLVEHPHIFDVQVMHSFGQPLNKLQELMNHCSENNGGCSHLCFLTPEGSPSLTACGCPYGYELGPDHRSCLLPPSSVSMVTKDSILYVKGHNSSQLLLPPLHLKKELAESKLFVDDKYLFFAHNQSIFRKNIITKKRDLIITLAPRFHPISVVSGPNHIVYILVKGIETRHGFIAACNSKGEHLTTLVGAHFPHPLAFTVDQVSGQIFWAHGHHSSNHGDHYMIGTCSPNGNEYKELVSTITTSGMGKPVRLELLPGTHLLFWLSFNGSLSFVNYGTKMVRLNFAHDVESFSPVASGTLLFKKLGDPTIYMWNVSEPSPRPLYKMEDSAHVELLSSSGSRKKEVVHCHDNCGLCINKKKCISHKGPSYVMYVQEGSPKALTDGHEVLPSLHTDLPLSLVHFHKARPLMFWTDSNHALHRSHTEGHGHLQLLPPKPSRPILGLAVDWQADNVYWICNEGLRTRIHVSRMDGKHPYIIYEEEWLISQLAVDPVNGYLYWFGQDKTIQQASLAGQDPHVLLRLELTLGELAVDPHTSDIYWTSPLVGRIEKVHPDGSRRTVIASGLGVHLRSMAISPEGIYWLDGGSSQREGARIMFCNKDGHNQSTVASSLGQGVSLVRWHGYSSYHKWDNPCAQGDNGGCKHLCFYHGISKNSYDCRCSHQQLGPDGFSCETSTHYLLMAHKDKLRSFKLANPYDPNSPLPKWTLPDDSLSSIALDSQNHILYYGDLDHPYLFSLDLGNGKVSPVLPGLHEMTGIQRIEGLALDSIRKELYWLDGAYPSIWKINLDSLHPTQILKLDPYDVPRSLALDACNRLLFWGNWKMIQPSIQVSNLSGGGHRAFVQDDVNEPASLLVHQGTLFWLDNLGDVSTINSISIHGEERKAHFKHVGETKAVSLAIHGPNVMYWTDVKRRSLYARGLPEDPDAVHIVALTSSSPSILAIYDQDSTTCQNKYQCASPCLNGGACGVLNDSSPPQCLCPQGFTGTSCSILVSPADYVVVAAIAVTAVVFLFLLIIIYIALRRKKLSFSESFGNWIKNASRLLHLRHQYLAKDSRSDQRTYVEYYNLSNPLFEDSETGPLYNNEAKLFFLNHPSGTASRHQGSDLL